MNHGPLDESIEFDWDNLYSRLGELSENELEAIHQKMLVLLSWVADQNGKRFRKTSHPEMAIARRFVAMAWVLCPDIFGQSPSMNHVAASLGMHKAVLSEFTSAFSKRFKVRNHFQAGHGWNFKKEK